MNHQNPLDDVKFINDSSKKSMELTFDEQISAIRSHINGYDINLIHSRSINNESTTNEYTTIESTTFESTTFEETTFESTTFEETTFEITTNETTTLGTTTIVPIITIIDKLYNIFCKCDCASNYQQL